jgi:hypothetical protein
MPVVSEGTVVGLLTPEGLARTIEAKTAERMRTRGLTVGTDGYSESGALSARA